MMMLHTPRLSAIPRLRHGFFTRAGGVSSGIYDSLNCGLGSKDDAVAVVENRKRLAESLGAPADKLITVYQVHSPDAVIATERWADDFRPRADAIVTATPGILLGVTAADCGPVLFADPKASVIGAAHAGWRGALTGVLEATIARMEELGAAREHIVAAIGPLIRQKSYEVGAEFVERFIAAAPTNAAFFIASAREGHSMFDLGGFIRARLIAAGIGEIEDIGLCTYADDRFFSYRRSVHRNEPDFGRHIHAIGLEA